jgi:hypothetical protein
MVYIYNIFMQNSSYRPFYILQYAPKELQDFMHANLTSSNLTIEEIRSLSERALDSLRPEENHEKAIEGIRKISGVHQIYFNHVMNNKPLTRPVYVPVIKEELIIPISDIDLNPDFDKLLG